MERRHKNGGEFHLVARYQPLIRRLAQLGVLDVVKTEHTFQNKGEAIARTTAVLSDNICAGCEVRIFKECAGRPGQASVTLGSDVTINLPSVTGHLAVAD